MADKQVSPYCMRCTKSTHGGFSHYFHETNEHDEWWAKIVEPDPGPFEFHD